MADPHHVRGLIDTSVVIDFELIEPARLPAEIAVSAITMAELAAGPHATTDPAERARRQDRLQRAEAAFEPLPVDSAVARAFGRVYAAVGAAGRKARGRRAGGPVHRGNRGGRRPPPLHPHPDGFAGLSALLDVVAVQGLATEPRPGLIVAPTQTRSRPQRCLR